MICSVSFSSFDCKERIFQWYAGILWWAAAKDSFTWGVCVHWVVYTYSCILSLVWTHLDFWLLYLVMWVSDRWDSGAVSLLVLLDRHSLASVFWLLFHPSVLVWCFPCLKWFLSVSVKRVMSCISGSSGGFLSMSSCLDYFLCLNLCCIQYAWPSLDHI